MVGAPAENADNAAASIPHQFRGHSVERTSFGTAPRRHTGRPGMIDRQLAAEGADANRNVLLSSSSLLLLDPGQFRSETHRTLRKVDCHDTSKRTGS